MKNSVKVNTIDSEGHYIIIPTNFTIDIPDICLCENIHIDLTSLHECNLLSLDSISVALDENIINNDIINASSQEFALDKYGIGILTTAKSMEKPLIYMFKQMKTQISLIESGNLNKTHIIKVANINKPKNQLLNLEYDNYRVIAVFDPNFNTNDSKILTPELIDFAKKNKIELIFEQTIYKLKEKYENHLKSVHNKIHQMYKHLSRVELEILPQFIFIKTSPILMGVKVKKGILVEGKKLAAVKGDKTILIGEVTSIQHNKLDVKEAKEGDDVCIKVSVTDSMTKKMTYGNDFDSTYDIITYIPPNDTQIYSTYKAFIEKKN